MPKKHNARTRRKADDKFHHDGFPSVFTCPDCSGTLFILKEGNIVRFRCRIGHLYSPESMMEAQRDNVERSLWTAVRALEEQAEYSEQLAQQVARDGEGERYTELSRAALERAKMVRDVIENGPNG